MKKLQSGFTLIELMIVIAIIGILAAIAIPAYQDYLVRTQVSEGFNLASGSKTAVAEYYSNKGEFPTSNLIAGQAQAGSITGKYVSGVAITQNATGGAYITATFSSTDPQEANLKINGGQVRLSGTFRDGSYDWDCATVGTPGDATYVANKYMPSACR